MCIVNPAMKSILTRLLSALPVVWLVVSIVFLLIHLVPGDPVQQMLGDSATAADLARLRHLYGLDQPLWSQYLLYWRNVLHGNLGQSMRLHDSVLHLIFTRYPYTLALTFCALVVAILLAVPAGVLAAVRRGGLADQIIGLVSLSGLSVPAFALAPLLILLFSIHLGWLPVSGAGDGSLWRPENRHQSWWRSRGIPRRACCSRYLQRPDYCLP